MTIHEKINIRYTLRYQLEAKKYMALHKYQLLLMYEWFNNEWKNRTSVLLRFIENHHT